MQPTVEARKGLAEDSRETSPELSYHSQSEKPWKSPTDLN